MRATQALGVCLLLFLSSCADDDPGRDGLAGPYATWKGGPVLYDLLEDIGETKDVLSEHPELVQRLEALAEGARASLGDKLTERMGTDVRPMGRVEAER